MSGATFREARELASALGAILLHYSHSKELAARGSSGEDAGSSKGRPAGHGTEGRKTSYRAKTLLGSASLL